jgi:hypothetical protein
VGFPEKTVQFCLWKNTGKDSSEACAIACQKCTVYSVSLSGVMSHSSVANFSSECVGSFRLAMQHRQDKNV